MKIKILFKYLIVLLLIIPLILMMGWSISSSWPWPSLLPKSLTLRGFMYILKPSTHGFSILIKSSILSLIVTFITLLISIPAARAIAFYDFWGKSIIEGLILLPLIVPMVTVAMGIHLAFIKLGLANTFLGVILIHVVPGIPYGVKILLNAFELSGNKIETQAKVLGASKIQVMKYIILPMIIPALITAGSLIYIISFSQYFITFLIGGGRVVTYSMFLFPFIESGDRTMASAVSVVFIASILLVMYISEKLVKRLYKKY